MAEETPDMFTMTYAGALGAFVACLLCGSLLADGDGTKQLHRRFHERVEPEAPKPPPTDKSWIEMEDTDES